SLANPFRLEDGAFARVIVSRRRASRRLAKPGEHLKLPLRPGRPLGRRDRAPLLESVGHGHMAGPPSLDQAARFEDHHDDQSKSEEEPPPEGEVYGRQRVDPQSAAKSPYPVSELGEKDSVKEGNNDPSRNDAADRSHA